MLLLLCCVGDKAQKRYNRLMLQRINWNPDEEDGNDTDQASKTPNSCRLVWEGSVKEPTFQKFHVEQAKSDVAGKKFLTDRGVGHYWDLTAASTDS